MRIFVTGASGWIGSAVVEELLAAGHEVLGMARSDASAERVAALGAEVHRGDLDDLDSLRAGAEAADGVVHLGYNHDFSRMGDAAVTDRTAISLFGEVLAGSGGPLLIASGTLGLTNGAVGTENDIPDPSAHPRVANAELARSFADEGRAPAGRAVLPDRPRPRRPRLRRTARRDRARAGRLGVHRGWRQPLARRAPARRRAGSSGSRSTARRPARSCTRRPRTASPTREIAEAIGRGLDLPVVSVPRDEAEAHFGWIGGFFAVDAPASSMITQSLLGWTPTHATLVEDLDGGAYYDAHAARR